MGAGNRGGDCGGLGFMEEQQIAAENEKVIYVAPTLG